MKKIFLKGFIASVAILSSVGYLSAAPTAIPTTDVSQEVSCEQFKNHGAKQGDQCFIEDRVYLGSNIKVTNFVDYYANMGDTPVVMFQRDKHGNAGFNTQFESLNGFQWVIDDKGDFFDLQGFKQDPNFGIYKVFPKRSKTLIMKSQPGKGIQPIKAPVGGNRETPSARVTFTTTTYNVSKSGDEIKISDTPQIHKEHIFFFTSWCGDGVVDREYGEEADDGANNGKPGYATLDCKKGKTPNPGVCDGASNGVQTSVAPTNLCKSGIPSVVTEHADKFTWTCGGESADVGNATCEAPKPPKPELPPVCDQTFHRELRYEQWKELPIVFNDYYHNNSKSTYVLKDFSVLFRESDDMNTDGKSDFNNFRWSNGIYSGYKIAPGVKNLEIITADPGYYLNKPPKKRQKDNIYIEYKVNAGPEGKEAKPHTECISYEISWCGDGILDTKYGEKCDPNDPTKKGWVNGSCDPVTCEPKPEKPEIKIKKYADHKDAQDYSDALSVDYGKDFTYRYVVTASGSVDHKKATVTDRLPAAVKVKNIKAPAGWECKTGSVTENGKVRPTIVCQTPTMKANSTAEFTVNAQFVSEEEFKKLNYPETVFTKGIRNISYVCTEEVTSIHPITKEVTKKVCAPDCTDPNDPKCTNDNPPPPECSTIPGHPHYDPACLIIPVKGEIKIKKYADHKDAQDYSDALSVDYGKDFTYRYVVTTSATGDHKKATVTDKLPLAVKVKNIKAPAGWECKTGSVTEKGKTYPTIVCQTPLMKANSTAEFTVNAQFVSEEEFKKLDYPQTVFTKGIRNIAYVCTEEVTSVHPLTKEVTKKVCAPDCTDPNDPKCTEENPPHHECSTIPGHPHYDPACLSIPTKPEINIKKYADHKDGQTFSDALSVDYGKDFTYRYVVSSSGSTDLTKATVTDKLPLGVKVTGFKTIPNGWTCKHGSVTENGKTYATAICQTPTMKANTSVEIVVNAQLVSDTEFLALNLPKEVFTQGLRNIAYVCTEEVKSVHPFTGVVTTKVCAPDCTDPNDPSCLPPPPPPVCSTIPGHPHYDPACVSVPTPPPYLTMMCIDDSIVITKNYDTQERCEADRKTSVKDGYALDKCYPKTIDRNDPNIASQIKKIEDLCKKTPPPPPQPYCGDGILNDREQCDPGTGRGPNDEQAAYGTDLCSATCDIITKTSTTPGENPIEFFIKIPTFSKATILGRSHANDLIPLHEYALEVGRYSPIFSYGDKINLKLTPKYNIPTQINANKSFQIGVKDLGSETEKISAKPKNFNKLPYWEYQGTKWYVLNQGDILVPKNATVSNGLTCTEGGEKAAYKVCYAPSNNVTELELFNGYELSDFKAGSALQSGRVTLYNGDADLASFQVTVKKSLVSAKGSSVSREVERIENGSKTAVEQITQNNTTNTATTATHNLPFGPSLTTQVKPIDANIRNQGDATISNAADLEKYKYNGNPNIYAIKGNVTINGPIEMKGVKTVLVEGKLTFNANTYYAQNDNNSSWAFITRGPTGEIQINSNVTHIAGVLMSINDTNPSDATGKIVADKSTPTILRIDGTVYGYAQDLFNKRTYVRKGTNHETDTTGTIITYSNRALRNPPPLLSQYLNAYKVKRLVR